MKKTLNVNLNGRVFTIDEDAYNLLDNYLKSLRICFRKDEGAAEIIADFEARIEELFGEKTRLGHQVITLEHVEEVIARVGKPADFEESEEETTKQADVTDTDKGKKRLYRNIDDKLIAGVCSGLAAYFGWNVVAIRIILIIATLALAPTAPFLFFANFPAMIIIGYLIMWLIVPAAHTVEQKLQMAGKPITAENIGKTVAAESTPVSSKEKKGCLAGFVDLFVSFIKVGFAGLGCLIGLPLLFALFIVIIVLIAVTFGVGGGLLGLGSGLVGGLPPFLAVNHPILATITFTLLIGIPVIAIIYSIISFFAKLKPVHQSIKWAFLLIWIISFVLFFFSGFRIDKGNWHGNPSWWPNAIIGNDISSQQMINIDEPFTRLEIGDYLAGTIYIEQIPEEEQPSLEIKGDENLVALIRHNIYDGRLTLSAYNRYRSQKNLSIYLRTNELKQIEAGFIGDIRMNRAFTGEEMEIVMKGVGSLQADSLYITSLTVRTEGVGSANLAGKAAKTTLETAGTGNINAYDLLSDAIYARVNGVGAIQCNPVDFLEGRVYGIGSITFKEEPTNKDVSSFGIGRIKRR